jgi:hypothetical protein
MEFGWITVNQGGKQDLISSRTCSTYANIWALAQSPSCLVHMPRLGLAKPSRPLRNWESIDELLPLDRPVFAVLEAVAMKLFYHRISENPFLRRSKQDAIADLIAAWDFFGPCIIQEGWEIYVA